MRLGLVFKFQKVFCALQILNNFCGRFSFCDRNLHPQYIKFKSHFNRTLFKLNQILKRGASLNAIPPSAHQNHAAVCKKYPLAELNFKTNTAANELHMQRCLKLRARCCLISRLNSVSGSVNQSAQNLLTSASTHQIKSDARSKAFQPARILPIKPPCLIKIALLFALRV